MHSCLNWRMLYLCKDEEVLPVTKLQGQIIYLTSYCTLCNLQCSPATGARCHSQCHHSPLLGIDLELWIEKQAKCLDVTKVECTLSVCVCMLTLTPPYIYTSSGISFVHRPSLYLLYNIVQPNKAGAWEQG